MKSNLGFALDYLVVFIPPIVFLLHRNRPWSRVLGLCYIDDNDSH